MNKIIAVLAGDGIGTEVVAEALRVLEVVGEKFGHKFEIRKALIGGAAFDAHGTHFPNETLQTCIQSDAILFGSVGGPVSEQHLEKWKNCEANSILALRKAFSFFANFRPIKVFPVLRELSPLKASIVESGVDILFVRELAGDIYFGEHTRSVVSGQRIAKDIAEYSEAQIKAVANKAFKAALERKKKITSVDKANVLETSRLWREVVTEVASEYPSVQLEHMLVDNCAMQLVKNPSQFDVILTSNLFGDILSDLGAVFPGSLGLMASASLNADGFGLYEPPGGSAPDIAGKGVANPVGQILSVALMLRYSFGLEKEALAIENSVTKTIESGARTADISRGTALTTAEFGAQVCNFLILRQRHEATRSENSGQ